MKLFDLLFGRLIDRRIAAYQNDLISRHYDEVNTMYRQMRAWRHDYHHHIGMMLALIDRPAELKSYLLELNDDLTGVDTVLKTGNVMVDAILNSKLTLIKSHEITVHAKAVVPQSLSISEVDLSVMLGNLLDNALEACLRQRAGEERFIRIYVGQLRQQLYLSVTNTTGEVRREGKFWRSTKASDSHGFGLMQVDRLARKYGGYVNRQYEPGVFATEVMLPLDAETR